MASSNAVRRPARNPGSVLEVERRLLGLVGGLHQMLGSAIRIAVSSSGRPKNPRSRAPQPQRERLSPRGRCHLGDDDGLHHPKLARRLRHRARVDRQLREELPGLARHETSLPSTRRRRRGQPPPSVHRVRMPATPYRRCPADPARLPSDPRTSSEAAHSAFSPADGARTAASIRFSAFSPSAPSARGRDEQCHDPFSESLTMTFCWGMRALILILAMGRRHRRRLAHRQQEFKHVRVGATSRRTVEQAAMSRPPAGRPCRRAATGPDQQPPGDLALERPRRVLVVRTNRRSRPGRPSAHGSLNSAQCPQ